MLVLKRKEGESIIIDNNIEIVVEKVENGYAKISINAPKNVKIMRKELLIEVKEENIESIKNLDFIMKKGE